MTKESFSFQTLLSNINQKLINGFPDSPPFTVQRLAELLVNPTEFYPSDQPQKFLSALERVLSVSSTIEDFEKLDTAELIKESQISQKFSEENELMGDDDENYSLNNGGAKSSSLLSQATSVVVMSPIPWATPETLEQQPDLDEAIPMLENEPVSELSDSKNAVGQSSNEDKSLKDQAAKEDLDSSSTQKIENQNSTEMQPSSTSLLSLQPENLSCVAGKSSDGENQLEEKTPTTLEENIFEQNLNSSKNINSEKDESEQKNAALKEKSISVSHQISEDKKFETASQSPGNKSIDKDFSEKQQSLEKEFHPSKDLKILSTFSLDNTASDIKPTESNSLLDDENNKTHTQKTCFANKNTGIKTEKHDRINNFESSSSSKKNNRKELDESESETERTNSDTTEATGFLGEKRRKLSEEPDQS